MVQQPVFSFDAPRVARQQAGGTDDTMTGARSKRAGSSPPQLPPHALRSEPRFAGRSRRKSPSFPSGCLPEPARPGFEKPCPPVDPATASGEVSARQNKPATKHEPHQSEPRHLAAKRQNLPANVSVPQKTRPLNPSSVARTVMMPSGDCQSVKYKELMAGELRYPLDFS